VTNSKSKLEVKRIIHPFRISISIVFADSRPTSIFQLEKMLMLNGNDNSISALRIDASAVKRQQTRYLLMKRSPIPADLGIDEDEDELEFSPHAPKETMLANLNHALVNKPKLQRTNANRVQSAKATLSKPSVHLDGYARHSYLCFARMVAIGHLRVVQHELAITIPPELVALCTQYHYVPQDGLLQLCIYMNSVLLKLGREQPCISMKMLHMIIAQYFKRYGKKTLSASQVQFYYDEIVRAQLVVSMQMKHALYIGFVCQAPVTYYRVQIQTT